MYKNPIAASVSQNYMPPPGHIRAGTVMAIPGVLQQFGHDPKPLLRRVGLSLKQLGNPETIVPLATIGRLLALCAEVCDCPHFGLLVGQQVPATALGVLGYTIHDASDVDTAL